MFGSLKPNISFALRTMVKNKLFTVTAILTLALGVGSTTAIFSVVYAVFEPMMPYFTGVDPIGQRISFPFRHAGQGDTHSNGRSWVCITTFAALELVRIFRRSTFRLHRLHFDKPRW